MSPLYEQLGSTDRISDSREDLNGVTTRIEQLRATLTGGTPSAQTLDSPVFAQAFTIGDDMLYRAWMFPTRLDRTVDLILRFPCHSRGAGTTDELSLDLALFVFDPTSAHLVTASATGTVQVVDQAVPDTAFEYFEFTAALTAATYMPANATGLILNIERVAATNDHPSDISIQDPTIEYAIVR